MATVRTETFANASATGTVATTPSPATTGTSMVLTAGHGARFPTIDSTMVLRARVYDPAVATTAGSQPVHEIVEITAHTAASDTFTIVRGRDGTSGLTWSVGWVVEAIVTEQSVERYVPDYVEQPWHYDALAWNMPASAINGNTLSAAQTNLVPYIFKIWVPETISVSTIRMIQSVNGATLTAGSNMVGLYDSTGARIGVSADQSTPWASGAPATRDISLTGGPFTVTGGPRVFVWGAIVTAGTTRPAFARGNTPASSSEYNAGLPAARASIGQLAAVVSGSGLPASFTPGSSITLSAMARLYMALL
jgi:hypothetical protein